ncbi:MAG TPA: hypothetical protein VEY93_14375, partial [Longimicrobium sp.]|nr:hypothetical protein [Longimicrobium sp.]
MFGIDHAWGRSRVQAVVATVGTCTFFGMVHWLAIGEGLMNRMWILLTAALVAGCGMPSGASLPSEAPSIEGTIRESSAIEAGRRILVEATAQVAGREPAAYITVPRGADVLAGSDEMVARASADELVVGARVR